jgi:phage-related tail fiber protein
MTVPGATGGWVVREIGIKDVDGELIAYGNFPATYKPIASEGSTREMVIRASVRVASASVVNLVVDTSVVLASRAWVENTITAAALIPGGLTGQLLAKASNADGDFEWIDITEGITVLVDVVQEVETLVAAQTVVNFGTVTTEGLAVYIEGVRLLKDTDYTVTSGSQITLATAYPAGTVLHAYQNDPLEAPEYLRPGLNLSDLTNAAAARANLGVASAGDLELFFMAQI